MDPGGSGAHGDPDGDLVASARYRESRDAINAQRRQNKGDEPEEREDLHGEAGPSDGPPDVLAQHGRSDGGDRRVHAERAVADPRNQGLGISLRPHQDRGLGPRAEGEGPIDPGTRFDVQALVPGRRDHADDLAALAAGEEPGHEATHRILSGEEEFGEGVVDDHRWILALLAARSQIVVLEDPSREQRDPGGPEVAGGDRPPAHRLEVLLSVGLQVGPGHEVRRSHGGKRWRRGGAHALHSRDGEKLGPEPLHIVDLIVLIEGVGRQPYGVADDRLRIESQLDVVELHEAPREQACSRGHRDGEGELDDHQGASEAPSLARSGSTAVSEQGVSVLSNQEDRRRQPTEPHRENDGRERDQERASVQARLPEAGDVARSERLGQPESLNGEEKSDQRADAGHHATLREELRRDTGATRSQSRSDAHLADPCRSSGQHEIGDARARHEEEEGHRSEQEHAQTHETVPDEPVPSGSHGGPPAVVALRVLPGELRRDGGQVLPSLLQRHPRGQPGHGLDPLVVPVEIGVGSEREEDLHPGPCLIRWNDTHDPPGTAVQRQRSSGDRGIGAEAAPPGTLGQERDVRGTAEAVLLGQEAPAQQRWDSENGEEGVAHPACLDAHRIAELRQDGGLPAHGSHLGERALPVPEVDEVGLGDGVDPALRRGLADVDDRVGIREGEGCEDDRVDEGEDDRCRRRAQGEGRHRQAARQGMADHLTDSVHEIVPHDLPAASPGRVGAAWRLPGVPLRVSETTTSLHTRFLRAHSSGTEVLLELLEMMGHLVLESPILGIEGHDSTSASRICRTARADDSQRARRSTSSRRPCAVRR